MRDKDLAWTVPVMRLGYAGRGLTYLVIAGFSLWAVWHGGEGEGPSLGVARPGGRAGGWPGLLPLLPGPLAAALRAAIPRLR